MGSGQLSMYCIIVLYCIVLVGVLPYEAKYNTLLANLFLLNIIQ